MSKWFFHDPIASTTYTFEINPKSGGTPSRKKKIAYQATTAGGTLVFEGTDEVKDVEIQGTLLTQAQLDAMNTWFDKRRYIEVTDDLARSFTIYITEFTATRSWRRSHPWRHDWTMRYLVVT